MTEFASNKTKKNNGLLGLKRGSYKKHIPLNPRQVAREQGLLYYNVIKPCKYGHVAKRRVSDGGCTLCAPIKRRKVYLNNREILLERQRLRRLQDPSADKARRRAYQQTEHGKNVKRIAQLNRHSKFRAAEGFFTLIDIENIKTRQENRCSVCNSDLSITGFHIDHKIPLSRNGSNWPNNLQLLCPTDNIKKQALTDIEYLHKLGKMG